MRSGFLARSGSLPWMVGGLYVAVLFTLGGAAWVSVSMNVPVYCLTCDPAAFMNVSPFYGTLSKIGILLWCSCGTICLFSAVLLRNERHVSDVPLFLLVAGGFTLFLMLDDLFLFHDAVAPKFLHLPEGAFFASYAIIVVLFLTRFRKTILQTDFALLLFAFGFFALSIAFDLMPENLLAWHYLYEDGAKLFGIVSWFAYFVITCFRQIELTVRSERGRFFGEVPLGSLSDTSS